MNNKPMSAGKHHKESMYKFPCFHALCRNAVCDASRRATTTSQHPSPAANTQLLQPHQVRCAPGTISMPKKVRTAYPTQWFTAKHAIQRLPVPLQPLRLTPLAHQSGAVLVVSLIMLLLLTLIGTTAMQTTSLEEKMAGNMRDRSIAFQAAESALRDAERDVSNSVAGSARNILGTARFAVDCGASTTGDTTDDGLCYTPGGYVTSVWTTTNMTAAPSVVYGAFTGAVAIANLSTQPRYIIEGLSSGSPYYYRITVRAQGVNANTVVWLQAVYKIG